jgi:hypothetical protein
MISGNIIVCAVITIFKKMVLEALNKPLFFVIYKLLTS